MGHNVLMSASGPKQTTAGFALYAVLLVYAVVRVKNPDGST
jgi:hypothetical protein